MQTKYTVHGVLAGAYRAGRAEAETLYHASSDDGETALCERVKEGALCDEYGTPPSQAVTCKRCAALVAKAAA